MGAPLRTTKLLQSALWSLIRFYSDFIVALTSAAGQDVASLPAGRAGLPHAVMLPRGLPSVEVCTAHLPGLEAVAAAGGGARRPRANPPTQRTSLCGAVLQGAGPFYSGHMLKEDIRVGPSQSTKYITWIDCSHNYTLLVYLFFWWLFTHCICLRIALHYSPYIPACYFCLFSLLNWLIICSCCLNRNVWTLWSLI